MEKADAKTETIRNDNNRIIMKIAITSTGNSCDDKLDSRFGRCSYFAIYDTENKKISFIPNPNKEVEEGAGTASVSLIESLNIKKVISEEFGFKIKSLMIEANIQMIALKKDITIKKIIELLNH